MPIVKKVTLIAIIDNEFNLLLAKLMYGLGGIMADRIEFFFLLDFFMLVFILVL